MIRPSPTPSASFISFTRAVLPCTGLVRVGDTYASSPSSSAISRLRNEWYGSVTISTEAPSESCAATLLRAHGAHRVLLVSDPYHSLRIRLMAEDLGFVAFVSPTRTSPVHGAAAFGKEIKEALGISVGRIIGFERLWKITG